MARIEPVADVKVGDSVGFVGDVVVKAAGDLGCRYELGYRLAAGGAVTVIGSGEMKRGEVLGRLETKGMAAGEYVAELRVVVTGREDVVVRRGFRVVRS